MIFQGVLELGWTSGVVPPESRGLALCPLTLVRHWVQTAPSGDQSPSAEGRSWSAV